MDLALVDNGNLFDFGSNEVLSDPPQDAKSNALTQVNHSFLFYFSSHLAMADSNHSITPNAESLKALGNDFFVKKEFAQAESHYSSAIELLKEPKQQTKPTRDSTPKSSSGNPIQNTNTLAILFTNRAASRLELSNFIGALEDSSEAISLDPTWTKAYYRKYTALSKLGHSEQEKFNVWQKAVNKCENSAWLQKQWREATDNWRKVFKKEVVVDSNDLLSRHRLMKTTRERLSTMAHL